MEFLSIHGKIISIFILVRAWGALNERKSLRSKLKITMLNQNILQTLADLKYNFYEPKSNGQVIGFLISDCLHLKSVCVNENNSEWDW